MASTSPATAQRLVSLDQFRGYTVLGMVLVNFVGSFAAIPAVLRHHHSYCSYADTIMPQFLFAVGFAFRLTFERRVQREGTRAAYGRMIRRLLGLALLSIVVYGASAPAETWSQLAEMDLMQALGPSLKRTWFQTLMHIAATSLWLLPVIRSGQGVRIGYALLSGILHVLLSWKFNFEWCNTPPNVIDGGPLGFLTWSIPAMLGTLACDWVNAETQATPWRKILIVSFALMLIGLGFSCGTRFYDVPAEKVEQLKGQRLAENPVIPKGEQLVFRGFAELPFFQPPDDTRRKWNYWMMSQRGGTLSYLTFSAGFSLLVFAGFHFLCDKQNLQVGLFRLFGTNALLAYILHSVVMDAITPFVPRDSPLWYVSASCLLYLLILWVFIRYLERNKVFIRL